MTIDVGPPFDGDAIRRKLNSLELRFMVFIVERKATRRGLVINSPRFRPGGDDDASDGGLNTRITKKSWSIFIFQTNICAHCSTRKCFKFILANYKKIKSLEIIVFMNTY